METATGVRVWPPWSRRAGVPVASVAETYNSIISLQLLSNAGAFIKRFTVSKFEKLGGTHNKNLLQ